MSHKINILYIGRHAEITEVVIRVINKNEAWHGMGTTQDNEAKALFMAHRFDIVLLGNGISESEELELRSFFTQHGPSVKIVQHYGGGSGLLNSEIWMALNSDT